ncbi:MAG TPA: histidine--tRNA ligase [Luteibaculaceae bacterium]|nr:histidine--tRNA ligase [Luteibaculaceae bacterium]
MIMAKPANPKGTRDFGPREMARRNYIFQTIRKYFSLYGYNPIETPAMELTDTLLGKYGEEGDRLIFRILNSGDYLKGAEGLSGDAASTALTNHISEKALRYDLTVPFARFVVQHQHTLNLPFKRSQIQPVWRADRPQKGRYREFYQCDADVVGSQSLVYEVELITLFNQVLSDLGIPAFAIKLNNRKVLAGIAEVIGEPSKIVDITVAIDKLDKVGLDGVNKELAEKGVAALAIEKLQPLIHFEGDFSSKLAFLQSFLTGSEVGLKGVEELRQVLEWVGDVEPKLVDEKADRRLELDLTLARGLNYYTGAIFEVKALGVQIGSICGGGRYDDLTGIFGLPGVSGVGISFGADRIYDVLEELNLFPAELNQSVSVLVVHFGEEEARFGAKLVYQLRKSGISAELYPDQAKIKKQMAYAANRSVPFVAIIGESELKSGTAVLKNMTSGEQLPLSFTEIIEHLSR